jgi:hypothetical protein
MDFWTWLGTPGGIEMEHAIITLLVAIAGYLSYLAHQQSAENRKLLNSHLEEHLALARDLVAKQSAGEGNTPPPGIEPTAN